MTEREAKAAKAFLDEIGAVCLRHGFSLAHEDRQGGFIIERFKAENIAWLNEALLFPDSVKLEEEPER